LAQQGEAGGVSSYISSLPTGSYDKYDEGHSWLRHTYSRLAWLYGHERAFRIMVGKDEQANADLKAWRRLGRRSA
jgi:hypothetical protein